MYNLMPSWYARKVAGGLNSNENIKRTERRGNPSHNQTHRPAMSLANTHTMNSSNTSQRQGKQLGMPYVNPYINTVPRSKAVLHCPVAAPTQIVNCDRDRIPMSQLTSSFESNGNGSHVSQNDNYRHHIPTRAALDSVSDTCSRGISPFNTNRSDVKLSSSSSNFSQMQTLSERNSFASSVTQRTAPESSLLHPQVDSYVSQGHQRSHGSHHSSLHRGSDLASKNSRNASQASQYSNHLSSHDTSNCGVPQFQSKNQDFSQSTCSRTFLSNSQSQASYRNDEVQLHAMIENRIVEILNARLEPKMKELDDRQLSFYRRITEADEKHIECIKEVESKHAACMKQIKDLDKRSGKIDHEFVQVTKTIAKCTIEMEKKAVEIHTKSLYVEKLYYKVSKMLKSVEVSTIHLKEVVANGISSITKAPVTVMESTLPLIKQKATEIMTALVAGYGSNINTKTETPRVTVVMESLSQSEDEHFIDLSENYLCNSPNGSSKKSRTSQEHSRSTEKNELKNIMLEPDELLSFSTKPLRFTKVNNAAYEHPTPAKVVKDVPVRMPGGYVEKTLKPAPSNKGKSRSLMSKKKINEKSMSQGKPIKTTTSYSTLQVNHPIHNTTPQPSKVVSPFASIASKLGNNDIAIYTPIPSLSTTLCRGSCETPNRNVSPNDVSPCLGKVRSPCRKRKLPVTKTMNKQVHIPEAKTMNKRARSRYGRTIVGTAFKDDEMEYSFLSK